MSDSIGSLALKLGLDATQFSRGLDLATGDVKRQTAAMSREILKVAEASKPENLQRTASLGIALAGQQATYNKALARETTVQKGAGIGAAIGGIFGERGAAVGGAVGGAAGGAVSSLMDMAALANPYVAAAKGVVDFSKGAVAKSNPATAQRYEKTVDDISGVLGQRLAPVLETVTDGLRLFGDFLHTVLPSGADFREMLAPFKQGLEDLRPLFGQIANAIRPLIQGFGDVVVATAKFGTFTDPKGTNNSKVGTNVLTGLAGAGAGYLFGGSAAGKLGGAIGFGAVGSGKDTLKSSFGASITGTASFTDAEGLSRMNLQGSAMNLAQQQVDSLQNIENLLDRLTTGIIRQTQDEANSRSKRGI